VGLKLHLEDKPGWVGKVFGGKTGRGGRRIIVIAHGWIGRLMPVVSWTQMLFGGIVALGQCRGDHLGQCLAHFIMGSAFIGYGIVMTILLMVGQAWLRRTGKSQEFFDSIIIAAWGCVNTFTEHRWGGPWVKNDLQHTSMGIVWWCAGLLGVWLSRSRNGRPRRNVLPGIVIMLTGWAMSAHPQELPLSTMVHSVFGYTLMAAGATRIIEICFLLRDSRGNTEPSSWQHLPPFVSPSFIPSFISLYPWTRPPKTTPIHKHGLLFHATQIRLAYHQVCSCISLKHWSTHRKGATILGFAPSFTQRVGLSILFWSRQVALS
jgi:hypothetical protein